ncbi:hypothetical protein F5Y15DRAFT_250214 [Xylariaceae sp. FL0016]|nr:hypothetical protein F5Y15DRAFT_250214 [Xylariaceae sp. FL0016]
METDGPKTPAQPDLIDRSIQRVLKENPAITNEHSLDGRKGADLDRVQNINSRLRSGDTLVVVSFPETGKFVDCNGGLWTSKKFLMDSSKLRSIGSSVFEHLLSPAVQVRAFRRHGLAIESFPYRYLVDLTPPEEGEDLASMLILASLSCGSRKWWSSFPRLNISYHLVAGHDDHCPDHIQLELDTMNASPVSGTGSLTSSPPPQIDLDDMTWPKDRNIPDYCPIRHRANILRLLLHIQGHDLVLDSAPRMFTMVCVAKSLECSSVVRDSVLGWVLADPNQDFIDVNTEDALKVGWMLECTDLTRVAFRILVTEKALEVLGRSENTNVPRVEKPTTFFCRPRADVTEEQETCIQHAGQAMADRARDNLAHLESADVLDWLGIEEWRKFRVLWASVPGGVPVAASLTNELDNRHSESGTILSELRSFARAVVFFCTKAVGEAGDPRCISFLPLESYAQDCYCYVSKNVFPGIRVLYERMEPAQRLMTTCFWHTLQKILGNNERIHLNLYDDVAKFEASPTPFVISYRGADKIDAPAATATLAGMTQGINFDLDRFSAQLNQAINRLCDTWAPHERALEIPIARTPHLALGLSELEFKYLPLWADGLDDGSGAVYQPEVPDAVAGPICPGPSYHTGGTIATDISSIAPSICTATAGETATLSEGRSVAAVRSAVPTQSQSQERDANGWDTAIVKAPSTNETASIVSMPTSVKIHENSDACLNTTSDNHYDFSDLSDDVDDDASWSAFDEDET